MNKYSLLFIALIILLVLGIAGTDDLNDEIATAQDTELIKESMRKRAIQDEIDRIGFVNIKEVKK